MKKQIFNAFTLGLVLSASSLLAQDREGKFSQLGTVLPTPNTYRTASGAPGAQYWQQRADYNIKVELNEDARSLSGEETITYYNNSPDVLDYVWMQLDQNLFAKDNESSLTETNSIGERMTFANLRRLQNTFDGGFKIDEVKDGAGGNLKYTVVHTMMRVDLPTPLRPGASVALKLKWHYNINDGGNFGGRCGYEFFPKDGNCTFHIAQFYPRMCRYDDVNGWQHKQYYGQGEFTLSFGNYDYSITVPDDYIVAASGELQNAATVLTSEQRLKYEAAKTSKTPVIIVSQSEAQENEKEKGKGKKTWNYKAENVRDVAFAASRKFIWDAMGVKMPSGKTVMAMSYYPKEGNPLWEKYSTRAVAHTLNVYSKHTFDYPYPVAISTHASFTGMEYPMICFNFGRPEADGTYSERIKYGMLGVIIHEVGHNYFPMIVNSDERQWMWMDEGLNSFLEFLTEKEWDKDYPCRRGPAYTIVDYMKGDKSVQEPIMTASDNIAQLGNNAYGKCAAALNILRETILGRELFDFAFKTYANRWKFKHPSPADFFRTMEDASGVDLDWFWRAWFYGTDNVDIAIDDVKWFQADTKNPEVEKAFAKQQADQKPKYIGDIRNAQMPPAIVETDPSMRDYYNNVNPYGVDAIDKADYKTFITNLSAEDKALLESGKQYYQINFSNKGGIVMPIILKFDFVDGTSEERRIPVEIWRMKSDKVSKVFVTDKEVKQITLDPYLETADVDSDNNYYPRVERPSRFQIFKDQPRTQQGENPMQRAKRAETLGN